MASWSGVPVGERLAPVALSLVEPDVVPPALLPELMPEPEVLLPVAPVPEMPVPVVPVAPVAELPPCMPAASPGRAVPLSLGAGEVDVVPEFDVPPADVGGRFSFVPSSRRLQPASAAATAAVMTRSLSGWEVSSMVNSSFVMM